MQRCGDDRGTDQDARAGEQGNTAERRSQLAEICLVRRFEDQGRQQNDEHELWRDLDLERLGEDARDDPEPDQSHGVGQVDSVGQDRDDCGRADEEYEEPNQFEGRVARIQPVDSPPAASTGDARPFRPASFDCI